MAVDDTLPEQPSAKQSTVVFRGWGMDRPGIANAFLKVVVECNCQVLDMAQFLLEGSLMFTFVLNVGDQSSMKLMKALTKSAHDFSMQVNFHFPDSDAPHSEDVAKSEALISLVSVKKLSPALLFDIDTVLCEHGCVVHEIEHRSDNKMENNNEYNKFAVRVGCPAGLKISNLYMGASTSSGTSDTGLQQTAWKHGAEVTVKWWDSLNRPHGKSLVVFGLSEVLCPCDVLDEVLKEAGVEAGTLPDGTVSQQNASKVSKLIGKDAKVVQKVIRELKFTPGARLVCATLKRMGFRLAIMTNTGVCEIADHAKKELGIDYAICRDVEVVDGKFTGRYTGDLSDVCFRKSDLLKLMADREGIEYRNVIVVGEFLKGLKAASARSVFETFGPNIFFNTRQQHDLTIVLYLLGFNGSEVQALRKRNWQDGPGESEEKDPNPAKRVMVQVSSQRRDPGQLKSIFKPLTSLAANGHVRTLRQCSLQDGGMCLGLDIHLDNQEPETMVKELLFECQKQDFRVMDVGEQVREAAQFAPRTSGACWKHYFVNRYVIVLVQKPRIAADTLCAVFGTFAEQEVNCISFQRLSKEMSALQLVVNLPEKLDATTFSAKLAEVSNRHGADIAFQKDDLHRWMRRLVVFDMDSTLIQQEVIDELAKIAGVEKEVKAITEAAMNGELNFFESLKSRVALLKGYNAEELFAKVKQNLIFTPGAKKLCSTLKALGYKMAVISGGFLPVAQEVQRHLGLDYAFANTLDVDETTGLLTGLTSGPVVTPQRKRALLATISNVEGCEIKQTIAVGDGANDIPMLNAAGLGIAFCAKPKVQAATEFRINQKDLSTVLFLIGVSEHAADRVTVGPSVADLAREANS